jgi:hypothetical protein
MALSGDNCRIVGFIALNYPYAAIAVGDGSYAMPKDEATWTPRGQRGSVLAGRPYHQFAERVPIDSEFSDRLKIW